MKKEANLNNYDPYEAFQKYAVKADSLQDFINRYHKAGKITDFNREADYAGHKEDMERDGFTIIPKGTSSTGEVVSYYGKI
jgi:hypothetical protein